jgi:hypothetical protein
VRRRKYQAARGLHIKAVLNGQAVDEGARSVPRYSNVLMPRWRVDYLGKKGSHPGTVAGGQTSQAENRACHLRQAQLFPDRLWGVGAAIEHSLQLSFWQKSCPTINNHRPGAS